MYSHEKKPGAFSSPLAVTGIILLGVAAVLFGLAMILKAELTHTFYSVLSTGLGFLAINPAILRMRSSQLWQGMLIGAAIASICWLFIK